MLKQQTPSSILSDVIHYMKYAKYLPELKRRETFLETIQRNKEMHQNRFPFLADKIEEIYEKQVKTKTILPAMRSLQFAGKAIEKNNVRIFNCSFAPINHYKIFSEAMFLLLSGVGFGYSVLFKEINQLPNIIKPLESFAFKIPDNIEGWADAIDVLVKAYFGLGKMPIFDFSGIREKGMLLITSGGKAPGAEPLKKCLKEIKNVFDLIIKERGEGSKLESVEVHSILCHEADAVLSGGIRRASMICLFGKDDLKMRMCKSGEWWKENPHFGRANNSMFTHYNDINLNEFNQLWNNIIETKTGDPGIYLTNNYDIGTNPCAEASLKPFSFCNLVEINANKIKNQAHFNEVCKDATFINTLQASYTNFHYLRPIWKKQTDMDALIGVGITGIASGKLNNINLSEGAEIVKEENKKIANWIGINQAARSCLIKPAGTSSLILETSSGLHDYYCKYYLRRVRVNKQEPIYSYLNTKLPELIEDEIFNPSETAVITFPQKAPDGANIIKNTTALELLERAKKFNVEWIRASHNEGDNFHNVSATIEVKENEWDLVGDWLWENRYSYHGITVLPHESSTHKQLPFESCDKETYDKMLLLLNNIDLTEIIELSDETNLQGELACFGGICSIT